MTQKERITAVGSSFVAQFDGTFEDFLEVHFI